MCVCALECVSARQVGDRRETVNDSHVRQLLYETSDLINRSEEDARRQPEGHRSSLRSAVRMHERARTQTLRASRREGTAWGHITRQGYEAVEDGSERG